MDKTTQGLKALAEYMGWKETQPDLFTKERVTFHISNITYNTSWDALVPVYAKVTSQLDFNAPIEDERYYIDNYYIAHDTNNVEAAFEAVVELVKLINKENGK